MTKEERLGAAACGRLFAEGLATRIVFICYEDTTWAPEVIKLNNPDRFSLLVGAITRSYTESVDEDLDTDKFELPAYVRNRNVFPKSVNEYVAHAKRWRDRCSVQSFIYEYHFWLAQYRDLGVLDSAKVIWQDVKGYKSCGCNGIVEDGSQRSFFPNGFAFYVYAETLFNPDSDFEELKEDYFSHAYGEDWREVEAFFEKLGELVDFRYLNGEMSTVPERKYHNPALVESFSKVKELTCVFESFVEAHKNMPWRAQTVAYRILRRYLEYCRGMIKPMSTKAQGEHQRAREECFEFAKDFGKYELEMERWYDHYLSLTSNRRSIGNRNL